MATTFLTPALALFLAAAPLFAAASSAPAEEVLRIAARPAAETDQPDPAADAFQLQLDGQPVPIQSVTAPSSPLILLTVFDVVGDLNRVEAARAAVLELANSAGGDLWLGILETTRGLNALQDPTRNPKKLAEAVAEVSTTGYAALLDTIEDVSHIASEMIAEAGVRVAVVYITDGSIYEYRADYTSTVINPSDQRDLSRRFRDRVILDRITKIETSLQGRTAPIFILHLEERSDSLNQVYQGGLQRFATATGGGTEFCRSAADVAPLFARLTQAAKSFALLTVTPPPSAKGRVRVELTAKDGQSWLYPAQRMISARE